MKMDFIRGTDRKFRIVCFDDYGNRIPGSTLVTSTDDGAGFERNLDVTEAVGMELDNEGRVVLETGAAN